jgi:hypothetical protein
VGRVPVSEAVTDLSHIRVVWDIASGGFVWLLLVTSAELALKGEEESLVIITPVGLFTKVMD